MFQSRTPSFRKSTLLARFTEAGVEPETFKYGGTWQDRRPAVGRRDRLRVDAGSHQPPLHRRRQLDRWPRQSIPIPWRSRRRTRVCARRPAREQQQADHLPRAFGPPTAPVHRSRQIGDLASRRQLMTTPAETIIAATRAVTKDWAKQIKAEEG